MYSFNPQACFFYFLKLHAINGYIWVTENLTSVIIFPPHTNGIMYPPLSVTVSVTR